MLGLGIIFFTPISVVLAILPQEPKYYLLIMMAQQVRAWRNKGQRSGANPNHGADFPPHM
jgi:hypothetical protein